ncbi:MAG: hypothetical protein M1827_005372 [Pycnora praestabilis]|nr:MAG: hypothetical protein M1827_005372 [Pycnora praestabilis]
MVPLPKFKSIRRPTQSTQSQRPLPYNPDSTPNSPAVASDSTLATDTVLPEADLKRATRTRKTFSHSTSFLFLTSVVFLILVLIGNTHVRPVLNNIYFIKLDLSHIVPRSVPNSVLINSIARTLGLHDFYTVGLWNFCEGYNGSGVTSCSSPHRLYWFNPVSIILNELLSGATIVLPANIISVLKIVETASHWMFGLFLTGIVLSFLSIFITPVSIYTRWASFILSIFTFLAALTTTAATIIATVMFIIFRNVFTTATEVNIGAELGKEMLRSCG